MMNMPNPIHVVLILLLAVGLNSCRSASSKALVVYVSEDQIFSEPILKDFERETAITVKSVFDTEESKSTGVMNRLIAEKDNPQADVYWANEPVRADALKQRGVSTTYVSPSAEGIPDQFKDPDQDANGLGVLILPNAVALIKGGPHPENGKQLIDYLLSRSTERKLAFADCAQIPLHSGVDTPPEVRRIEDIKPMRVGYADLARKMEEIQPFLKEWAGQ